MRSDFRLQKLILLLILSFSTLSGCIGLPSESDPSPTPETPVSNEQSQASGAEGSNSSDAAPNSSPTQEPTELEKKWDEFLMALSINITNESPENFKAVQTKAQELKELAKIPPDLAGLRTYLQDAIISYQGLEPIQQTFNNDLVIDGLGFRDLAIGDPNTLLSDENKQSTAQLVVNKLNSKYRSLLVSSSSTPGQVSPSPSISPTESPASPPAPPAPRSEVEIKWDNFLEALKTNITNESSVENFEKVKQAATELQGFPGVPKELLDAVINYQGNGRDPVHKTFNDDLVKTGLGIRDLAVEDPTKILSKPEDRGNTATKIVDTLNEKYRSQLVSPVSKNNENNPGLQFLTLIGWIGLGTVVFLVVNRKFNMVPALNNYLPWPAQANNLNTSSPQNDLHTGISNSSRELDQIKANVSNHQYRFQEYDRKFQEYDREILSLKQTVQTQEQQIKMLITSNSISVRREGPSIQPQQTISSVIPISSAPQKTENSWKQMIRHSTAVEDTNLNARRSGSGEVPFFVPTKSRQAHLGVYQHPLGQFFLLPIQPSTNHEKLNSYFDLQGSVRDGEVEVIQPAIVIPSGQGWELYQKGIISFDMGNQLKMPTPTQPELTPEKTSPDLEEAPVISPSPIILPVVFHLKLEVSQNIYKQIISQSTPVEDTNLPFRRMGSGETPFFVSTKSRSSHLSIYKDLSGQFFLLPAKPKTNHEKLSSYFDLLEGSPKDGAVEVIQPALVIPSGHGWQLSKKGMVSFN